MHSHIYLLHERRISLLASLGCRREIGRWGRCRRNLIVPSPALCRQLVPPPAARHSLLHFSWQRRGKLRVSSRHGAHAAHPGRRRPSRHPRSARPLSREARASARASRRTPRRRGGRCRRPTSTSIVLDIMMPGEDGLSLTRSIRETKDIPVILLTAMGEETDRIVGLEVGADDYLGKALQSARAAGAHQGGAAARADAAATRASRGQGRLRFDRWILDLGRRELVDEAERRRAALERRVPPALGAPRAPRHGADPRPAPRPDARALGAALRPLHRQPDQPAAQEDRARPAQRRS